MGRHTLEYVEWWDAVASNCWTPDDVDLPPHKCISIGKLIAEKDTHITLASTWGVDGEVNCLITIPKGWIEDRRTIKV